jgi:uridine phosphorylase
MQRAEKIAKYLHDVKKIISHRGFCTYTGVYRDKLISIVAIGMVSLVLSVIEETAS